MALGKASRSLNFNVLHCATVMIAPTTSFKELWDDDNEMLEVTSRVDGEELKDVRGVWAFEPLAGQHGSGCTCGGPCSKVWLRKQEEALPYLLLGPS